MSTVDEQQKPTAAPRQPVRLTDREFEVLFYMSYGATNGTIARRLQLTEATIKTYSKKLFEKLACADRAHAVRRGFELGLLDASTDEPQMDVERPPNGAMRQDFGRLPLVDWQVLERARIAENREPRPISVRHIGACFAAAACPCRTGSTWEWPAGQQFADPVPMPEVNR